MVAMEKLYLEYNQIADLAPLVANSGLGAGDDVWVEYNPLSSQSLMEYIPALQARGATVHY